MSGVGTAEVATRRILCVFGKVVRAGSAAPNSRSWTSVLRAIPQRNDWVTAARSMPTQCLETARRFDR